MCNIVNPDGSMTIMKPGCTCFDQTFVAEDKGPWVKERTEKLAEAISNGKFDHLFPPKPLNPLHRQVGGSHYKSAEIELAEYVARNNTPAVQFSIMKYITRIKGDKEKRYQDLKKAQHWLEILCWFELGRELHTGAKTDAKHEETRSGEPPVHSKLQDLPDISPGTD